MVSGLIWASFKGYLESLGVRVKSYGMSLQTDKYKGVCECLSVLTNKADSRYRSDGDPRYCTR